MNAQSVRFAPGMRLLIRDAEWWLKRVDITQAGHAALSVVGLSEIVRGREAVFLSQAEEAIEVLDPAETKLVGDGSPEFRATRLHLESQLRKTPPTGTALWLGHRGAMDALPFQLDPAAMALRQPRQRILIADTVGLGKTLEAGILTAELARRGRARRILVVTVKSLLEQFQKEWWSRFTLPLVRLDSIGLQRVRSRIPTHQNPFYYYDRSIISIDTLKQDNEFRHHLEQAYWDVIVIDEAHNVAKRGSRAQRHQLAELLATRSDTLIMLSATPHDGRKESFASLMNMLDPTAIPNEKDYGPEQIQGLYVRRFRSDVRDQLRGNVPDRKMTELRTQASPEERTVFTLLDQLTLSNEAGHKENSALFRTTLLKGFLSSPVACLETLRQRIAKLEKGEIKGNDADLRQLRALEAAVAQVQEANFSKYQELLRYLKNWKPAKDDRLVLFTERIATLQWLRAHLPQALKLKDNQVEVLDGSMEDTEQMRIVDAFGQEDSPVRLLLASDVASEGINLHYQCHRLVHFDIPWSLMVFAQRNGRIDRYGQRFQPELAYLLTCSELSPRTDERVLELLVQKDQEAQTSIGDPSALIGVYTIEEQEAKVTQAIETGEVQSLNAGASSFDFDPFELMLQAEANEPPAVEKAELPSLYEGDFAYAQQALQHLHAQDDSLQFHFDSDRQELSISVTRDDESDDLASRFHFLPREVLPERGSLVLSAHAQVVQKAMEEARKSGAWPNTQYLWPLHPVLEWIDDRVQGSFGRHQAPVVLVPGLRPSEALVLLSGLYPNRIGQPLVHRWVGVLFREGKVAETLDLLPSLDRCGLRGKHLVNTQAADEARCKSLQALLGPAIAQARRVLGQAREAFLAQSQSELQEHERQLQGLLAAHDQQIELAFAAGIAQVVAGKKEQKRQSVRKAFEAHRQWMRDAHHLEEHAHFAVLAVCTGG